MTVCIADYKLTEETHNLYDVTFFNDKIHTLVTHSPFMVDSWISEIHRIHRRRLNGLIVGFDIKWRPNHERYPIDYPVATIHLCVGRRCLIFQLIHASSIPESLFSFLNNVDYTFVGVNIDKDAKKLMEDYGLEISTAIDLGVLAVKKLNKKGLRDQNPGLKTLTKWVLDKDIENVEGISWTDWDNKHLTAV